MGINHSFNHSLQNEKKGKEKQTVDTSCEETGGKDSFAIKAAK
jgi:hypothetical protein